MSAPATPSLGPEATLRHVLEVFPGAQRTLFRHYHIGGCSSCGFQPEETLAQLCARNGNLDVAEVLARLQTSHEQDARTWMSAAGLAGMLKIQPKPRLVDIRSREEWEAVRLEGAVLLTQTTMQEILGRWPREALLVVYDHQGRQALDAAAYFAGQGFQQVRCLAGGIDAWAREVDGSMKRYRLAE
ncbi:MAG: rhodanese-like domain-containing protein [Verrucomicrobia bacterium]|nr:rhodanese-like domain-containing protein [Verrucomicrobiota bacterium]